MNNQHTATADSNTQTGLIDPTEALSRFVPSGTTLSAQVAGAMDNTRSKYGFRIGSIGLIVPGETGSEVIESLSISPLPNTVKWFAGLVNLRGNLVPVFDLHILFGESVDERVDRRLLVIDKGERAIAIPIDDLPRPLDNLENSTQIPPVPVSIENHVRAAGVHDQNLWLEIDMSGFFESLGKRVATA